jgi:hypothetical protein
VLRGYRPVALFIHHVPYEFLLADIEPMQAFEIALPKVILSVDMAANHLLPLSIRLFADFRVVTTELQDTSSFLNASHH